MIIAENTVYCHPTQGAIAKNNSVKIVNLLAIELLNYGIYIEKDLRDAMGKLKVTEARSLSKLILKTHTMGNLTPPLFPNWEKREAFTIGEIIVQIIAYVFQIDGNDLYDPDYLDNLGKDFTTNKIVTLASQEQAIEKYNSLAESRVPLDMKSVKLVVELAKVIPATNRKRIFSDEVRVAVINADSTLNFKAHNSRPSDVLRLFALRFGDNTLDMKLPVTVKFDSLKWSERVEALGFLNNFKFETLCEEMGKNRNAWKKFFNHIHIFGQKKLYNRFPTVINAAMVSVQRNLDLISKSAMIDLRALETKGIIEEVGGKFVYRTFASRVETTLNGYKTFDQIVSVFEGKGNYVLSNLSSISNKINKKDQRKFVEFVRGFLKTAPVKILFSILSINVNAEWRVIDVKGNTKIEPAQYNDILGDIQGDIKIALHERFGFEGKVEVDEDLLTQGVPFLTTSSELSRGTRYKFTDDQYLFFFMKWIQPSGQRTDLDHSWAYFDKNWNAKSVSFMNSANSFIAQSGDLTSAPAPLGASEYSTLRLENIPKNVKYVVPCVYVYAGASLSDNEEAYAGFYFSNQEKFSLNRNFERYDFTQTSRSNVPFVIDVENREIIVVDYNQQQSSRVVQGEYDNIRKLIEATKSKNYITIETLAEILSGDSSETSLKITSEAVGKTQKTPQDLYEIFS